jgi:cytochrome P450
MNGHKAAPGEELNSPMNSKPAVSQSGEARPPGPPGPFFRLLISALRNPLGELIRLHREYGPIVTMRRDLTFLVAHPDGIKHVLQDNHTNYVKGSRYRRALSLLMGDGLLTAEGEAWKLQRKLAQPAFLRKQHAHFAATLTRHTSPLVDEICRYARENQPFDLHHRLAHHSLTIMLDLMFSEDLGERSEELASAFLAAEGTLNIARVFLPVTLPLSVPTPGHLRFRGALKVLDGYIHGVIAARRNSGVERSDLLSMYLSAHDEETGDVLSDQLVRDEMITLLSAGHETVSDAITWAFYELINHPAAYDRVCAEADALSSDAAASFAEPPPNSFIAMVFLEALRLYPPGWGFLRTAIHDDNILGFRIPAGCRLILSPYVIHRDSAVWKDPDVFDPERFSTERSAGRHRFAWFPFSGGPRQCIGAGLALMEAHITLTAISRVVRLEMMPGTRIRPLPRVSLKPDRPVMVRARLRPGGAA